MFKNINLENPTQNPKTMSNLEIERAYYTFNEDDVVRKLKELADYQEAVMLKQCMFKLKTNAFGRVRSDGTTVTMTIKERVKGSIYERETEMKVSSYNTAIQMFLLMGAKKNYDLEKIRRTWTMGDCEVVMDTYPGLPPYIEVEGPTEEHVNAVALLLDLFDELQSTGEKELYTRFCGLPKDHNFDSLTFETITKTTGTHATRNKQKFEENIRSQMKFIKNYF
jgi:predicted adenylyl cyclase CyaB